MKNNVIKNFFYSLKRVWRFDKGYVILNLLSNILWAVNSYTYSFAIKFAIEAFEESKPFDTYIINILSVVVVTLILSCTIEIISNYFWTRTEHLSVNMTREFHLKSLNIDYEKFERSDIQDLHKKAHSAISYSGILGMVENGFGMFQHIVSVIIACAIISQVSLLLIGIIVACSIFKYFLGVYREKVRKRDLWDKLPPINRKITYANNISKNLSVGKDMRIYDMNLFVDKEREAVVEEYNHTYKKFLVKDTFLGILKSILDVVDELVLYGYMIYEVLANGMKISMFSFMISSVNQLTYSISSFIREYGRLVGCSLRVNDYIEFFSQELFLDYEIKEYDEEFKSLEFKNVSYSYYLQEGKALDNVSFKISNNEKLALVGYNGAGKTTLIKLICGLYHATEGEILINGINIERFDRKVLAKFIAPVFQDTVHYSIDIEENITLSVKPDSIRIDSILKDVDLYDRIESLPLKKKSIISRDIDEKGIDLSGGESQKLSLARAIYKDSPLMILDEPTSAMDAISESNLYTNINKLINNHSAIFISHRLSSTKFCDRIIMLDNGRIIESGTHQELLNENGEYAKLFNMQAEYYKGGDDNA